MRSHRVWLLGVAVLSMLASRPMAAICPSVVMIYGEGLPQPVYVDPDAREARVFDIISFARR